RIGRDRRTDSAGGAARGLRVGGGDARVAPRAQLLSGANEQLASWRFGALRIGKWAFDVRLRGFASLIHQLTSVSASGHALGFPPQPQVDDSLQNRFVAQAHLLRRRGEVLAARNLRVRV